MKIDNRGLISLFFVIGVVITSCTKQDAPDRDKFLGTWHVSSHGSVSGDLSWDMGISASNSASDQILISNFDQHSGTTTFASVSGNNFVISQQIISGDTIQGGGSYSNSSLSFHYTTNDGVKIDNVTATAKK